MGHGDYRSAALLRVAGAVQRSRYLADLGDNWDGEGAKGYSRETWKRTAEFAIRHANLMLTLLGATMPPPSVGPADMGSIDLFWRLQGRTLLINFPADPKAPATFYGETDSGSSTSGLIPPDGTRPDIIGWLIGAD